MAKVESAVGQVRYLVTLDKPDLGLESGMVLQELRRHDRLGVDPGPRDYVTTFAVCRIASGHRLDEVVEVPVGGHFDFPGAVASARPRWLREVAG